MKKIFTLILVVCLSLVAFAQTTLTSQPQALKSIMAKEHLSNTLQAKMRPAQPTQQRVAAKQTTEWGTYSATAKAPANLTGLDTTEVHFDSFYEDPYFYEPSEWYFVLRNERYQFIFDIMNGDPNTMAGTYTEKDIDEWFSWCMFPEANGKTHYYKTCELTIQEEKISNTKTKYVVDAVVLATKGIGGEEYGYFKIHAEHTIVVAKSKMDVALYNCTIEPEEDRFRIAGKDDECEVDLTFFTETGVDGYYTHKLLDDENSMIAYKGNKQGVMELEGVIYGAENIYGGLTYVFMFEAMTNDTCFYNVAMEAPVQAKDTIEITCTNAIVNDMYGASDQTILVDASTPEYEISAAYNASKITTPAEYPTGSSYVYLTNNKTGELIQSIVCNLKITGTKTDGYQIEIRMLGTDYKYYIMHLSYGIPAVKETKVLDFKNNSKTMYYIDILGLKELQMANYDGEYSVSFDILYIDQVMDDEFDIANMFEEQTFLIHHVVENGDVYDVPVKFAEFGGKIWQDKDTTFLTASILGFDSIQYEISMFYTVPTPTETVTYDFDGLGDDVVDFTNAVVSSQTFILDAMSADGLMMAKVYVERMENESIEGTFYNDGNFDHSDFYPTETWVKVWNESTKEYDEYSVVKGSVTVELEDNIITAVASFICDNAVQYDLTFRAEYARERILWDKEDEDLEYTFEKDAIVEVVDWIEGYRIIELYMLPADESLVANFYFIVDYTTELDPEIGIPAGVYPINGSWESGTTLACKGILPDGPAPSYVCYVDKEGYLDPLNLWCLVDGTVTIEKVNGKMKVEVDAINSYERSVKLHYDGTTVPEAVPTSFPRKYLIEHFTGDQCGYCPYGMYSIMEYSANTTTPCIWVSHHYGYNTDEYTISESSKIGSTCGVSGAPNMAMNRTKVYGTTIAFHPGYLLEDGMPETIANKCATTAEASVVIDHNYNADTRELNVTVSGQVADATVTEYLLTVLIKENGLIGKQADYYWSWKTSGYKEFMHPCVVRDLLCADALGDKIEVVNQAYSKNYTFTVPEAWVAENCQVVAYITSTSKKPIINAEETPLVAGTTGGTEYQPFGITESKEPTNATKLKFDAIELNKPSDDKLEVKLVASSSTRSDFYGPLKMVVTLEFNTPDNVLPKDTFTFAAGDELNTFSTGTVDLVEQTFGGSRIQYYLAADMEELCHTWRINSGNLLVYPNGDIYTSGKLANGKNFAITVTLPTDVENVVFDKAHVEKLMREGQIIISIDGVEYDIQGRIISK